MTSELKRVCVVGASGRMGGRVLEALASSSTLVAHSALEASNPSKELPPGLIVSDDPEVALTDVDVVIDFSAPPACTEVLPVCAAQGTACIIASTGLSEEHYQAIDSAAEHCAVIVAANCSVGVNVLLELVELASKRLAGFEPEIFEIHHKFKRDAPSGTALALGEAVARGRGPLKEVHARVGVGDARHENELGYGTLRGGDVSGEHTVFFFGEHERIELTHRSTSPTIFARGAVQAAEFLLNQPPGRYGMRDVLLGHVD
ncbi:MAG: 4-hydroxy-tetrahydrodipicolinate reductase [Myxococcota bacterium]|nr:4-hydroxy-tetrahydrodipicolinate reductase [Myxococcota bacterium]